MRLVDGEQLEGIIYKYCCNPCRRQGCDRCRGCKANSILKLMKALCSIVEAKPVVHAHWVNYNDMFPCQCSNCNGFALSFDIGNYQKEIESDFCPHCGAQMDEVVSDTNVGSKTDEPFPQAHENGNNTQKVSVDKEDSDGKQT